MLPTARELDNYIKRKTDIIANEVLTRIGLKLFSSFSRSIVTGIILEEFSTCSQEEMKDIVQKTEKQLNDYGYDVVARLNYTHCQTQIMYTISIKTNMALNPEP